MKIVCAWCGKVLNENSEKEVSHVICPECYDREMRPFVEEQRRAREERAFKLPSPPFDWFGFLHRHMLFSLAFGGLFFATVLAAEGLHWITGGKVPSLIEWIAKLPPASNDAHWQRLQRRLRDFDFRPATEKAPEPVKSNQGSQNENMEE